METVLEHRLGETMVRYPRDPVTGRVGFELLPAALTDRKVPRRATLRGEPWIDALPGDDPWPATVVDALVQVKFAGEEYPGAFAQGHTMRQSPGLEAFRFAGQQVERTGAVTTIVTRMRRDDGVELIHRLEWREGARAFTLSARVENRSSVPVTLEMLGSFSLGGITPFATDDAPGRLFVHRFRSGWSAEGRHERSSLEALHLERSWSGAAAFSERFGQVGSMPVRRWFPFVAVEDAATGVFWGARSAWAGSWQLEVYRQHDDVCLSGGLADREFGHWTKSLAPGESLDSPPATVACVAGGLDELCDALGEPQQEALAALPAIERDLPVVFNEWCTTWGDPSAERLAALAQRLAGTGVRYLVIDAGWYKGERGDWGNAHGDWVPSARLFPRGLEAAAAEIRAAGLVPGLWFEMETVGDASDAFDRTDLLLHRDGRPLTVRHRRFWDLRKPEAVALLAERVIGLLERGGFGYLKVDYNETIGLGCDGEESQGEGLRRQILGVYRFFELIRKRLPELVIENCSSGGHRLEPSMLALTAMSSFSDAHELVEIPLIAANLHRHVPPRQSQIWAVLHAKDDDRRLVYSLAATFLGRMCLSGGIDELSPAQFARVIEAIALYKRAAPIIAEGRSRRQGEIGESWRHPRGWQAMVRVSKDGGRMLIVAHTFTGSPETVVAPLPPGRWRVTGRLGGDGATVEGGDWVWRNPGDFGGAVAVLEQT